VSCALQAFDEPIPDSVPLTSQEKTRKRELEQIVENGLETFLRVGASLCELRNRRLYRTSHATFADYCRDRFHLHRSAVDGLIRSSQTAETLLEAGIELPPDTNPTSLRSISALPGDDSLKTACWQLAQRLSPARTPPQPLVSKLCRLVRNCLEDGGDLPHRNPGKRRSPAPLEREVPFIRPIQRLASWSGFNPEVVTSHIEKPENAKILFTACLTMIGRLSQVQQRLISRFPEVEDSALVEHNQS
jgi:hypothetical protein